MSNYLENFKDEYSGSSSLVFNKGLAGIVDNVKIVVEKNTEDNNKPAYQIKVYDNDQLTNAENIPVEKIYPANKGYFKASSFDNSKTKEENRANNAFVSDKAETYAVNELKHLCKTFGHKITKNDKGLDTVVPERQLTSYNDFLDYTMEFINKQTSASNERYKVCVDYGTNNYPKAFLQLNGFPWFIVGKNEKIVFSNNALIERPKKDDENDVYGEKPSGTGNEISENGALQW